LTLSGLYFLPPKDIAIETPMPWTTKDEILYTTMREIYNICMTHLSDPTIIGRIDSAQYVEADDEIGPSLNRLIQIRKLKIIACKQLDNDFDWQKGVEKSIDSAKGQFTGTRPSIICIELHMSSDSLRENDYNQLRALVERRLQSNSRISVVIISFEDILRTSTRIGHGRRIQLFVNKTAEFPIPNDFKIV